MQNLGSKRIFGLDVIRATAIILVMSSHCAMLVLPDNQTNIYLSFFKFLGAIGVDLFFVLSGFLIGRIILRHIQKNETSFKDILYFWIRRWFRTLPNYFLLLILNIIIFYSLFGIFDFRMGEFILFIQNFASPHPNFFPEAWSLSIEEYAYIFGPLVLFILVHLFKIRNKSYLFLMMTSIVVVTVFILRYLYISKQGFVDYNDWSRNIRKVVVYRIDSIYFGFFAAYISITLKYYWQKFKYVGLVLGLILFIGMHAIIWKYSIQPNNSENFYGLWYLILLPLSLLLIFPYFSLWQEGGFFKNQIRRTSKISYSLYLVNMSLVFIPLRHFVNLNQTAYRSKIIMFILYWALSFLIAGALYRFYEKPLMDLRNHRRVLRYFGKT